MPFISLPCVLAQAANIPYYYGFCLSPPIVWHSLASAWNAESGTGIQGRYLASLGEVHSVADVKRQDSYLQGTAGMTGIGFDLIAGTWTDSGLNPQYHTHWLSKPSGGYESGESSVKQHSSTNDIMWCEIVVRRGYAPIIASPGTDVTHSKQTNYCYLELASGSPDLQNYRICLEYGQPVRMDVSYDGSATWTPCAICRDLGNTETVLAAHGSEIRFKVKPDPAFRYISVEVGNGNFLVHTPDSALLQNNKNITSFDDSDHLLPTGGGKIRIAVMNGSCSVGVFPVRHDQITIQKSPKNFGRQIPNSDSAFVVGNGLTNADPSQTAAATVNSDGQTFSYSLSTTMPDAGDGLGSNAPAVLSDAALVIPSTWVSGFDDMPDPGAGTVYNLPVTKYVEISNIDDTNRCGYTRGVLTFDNHYSQFANSYSNAAISVANSVDGGGAFYQRLQGVTQDREGGIKLMRADPQRLVEVSITDKTRMMSVGLTDEICFDGWCIYSVVRYLAEQGNIHLSFVDPEMPMYVPPGATSDAPYGPSGDDCPYFSLPRGSGLNPRFKFLPGEIVWNILTMFATICGDVDPDTGARMPFYTAFDEFGILYFKAVNFASRPIVQSYSTNDLSGYGAIEELTVFNSMADVRTSVDFEGIDAKTFELLYQHIDQPSWVKAAKGWRESWLERNAMYSTQDFLLQTSELAAYQASLPVQSIVMRVPYLPWIFCGMNIAITDDVTLGGLTVICNIKEIRTVIATNANGLVDSFSLITSRNILTP